MGICSATLQLERVCGHDPALPPDAGFLTNVRDDQRMNCRNDMGCENRARGRAGRAKTGFRPGKEGEESHGQKFRPNETWNGSVSLPSCEFTKERDTATSKRS